MPTGQHAIKLDRLKNDQDRNDERERERERERETERGGGGGEKERERERERERGGAEENDQYVEHDWLSMGRVLQRAIAAGRNDWSGLWLETFRRRWKETPIFFINRRKSVQYWPCYTLPGRKFDGNAICQGDCCRHISGSLRDFCFSTKVSTNALMRHLDRRIKRRSHAVPPRLLTAIVI